MKKNVVLSFLAILFFIAGFLLHAFLGRETQDADSQGKEIRLGIYKYINPLLDCDVMDNKKMAVLSPLKTSLEKIVKDYKEQEVITDAAIYFRDLNNGPWLGINEKQKFIAASLFKIPTMLLILKLSENESGLLDLKKIYSGQYDDKDNLIKSPEQSLMSSSTYSVREMLEKMIIFSDNKSYKMLKEVAIERTSSDNMKNALSEIGIVMPATEENNYEISVKNYSSLLRVLYNASLLNRLNSEYALKLLAQSDFDQGISASIPPEIIVANKFGFYNPEQEPYQQLHDCGIVYYPENPYLLCIMTKKKNNVSKSIPFINEVSKEIYEYWNGIHAELKD